MVTSLLKPTNQASLNSSLVPVLPPMKDDSALSRAAVPRATTPCRMRAKLEHRRGLDAGKRA